jgi:hypothetical protein
MPNLSQFLPIEIACGPVPRLPTNEQHLQHQINYKSFANLFNLLVILNYTFTGYMSGAQRLAIGVCF